MDEKTAKKILEEIKKLPLRITEELQKVCVIKVEQPNRPNAFLLTRFNPPESLSDCVAQLAARLDVQKSDSANLKNSDTPDELSDCPHIDLRNK